MLSFKDFVLSLLKRAIAILLANETAVSATVIAVNELSLSPVCVYVFMCMCVYMRPCVHACVCVWCGVAGRCCLLMVPVVACVCTILR